MSIYYSNTDRCPIYNNVFVSTTTEILSIVHDTDVTDVVVIYLEECRYMFHTMYITIFCCDLESIKYPRVDSVG